MKKFHEAVFSGLFAIVILWGEFGGLYHTYTRHRDQFWLAVFVPPVSWYRGVEMFGHREYSGKRWEKRMYDDAQTIVYLINASGTKDYSKSQLADEAELFSKRISKYPKKNRQVIRTIFDDYVRYLDAMNDEYSAAIVRFIETGSYDLIRSDRTKELEMVLERYGLKENMALARKYLDSIAETLPKTGTRLKEDDSKEQIIKQAADNVRLYLELGKQTILTDLHALSKRIFG